MPAARRLLAAVQLCDLKNRRPAQLSGGERQRLTIDRLLLKEPRVVILDDLLATGLDGLVIATATPGHAPLLRGMDQLQIGALITAGVLVLALIVVPEPEDESGPVVVEMVPQAGGVGQVGGEELAVGVHHGVDDAGERRALHVRVEDRQEDRHAGQRRVAQAAAGWQPASPRKRKVSAALRAYAEDQRFATQTFVAVDPGGLDAPRVTELMQEAGLL